MRQGGPTAASVRAVAAKAGIGASTLRHYFPTQQALSDAVYRHRFHLQVDDRGIADTARPAAERLTECLQQFMPSGPDEMPVLRAWVAMYHTAVNVDTGLESPLRVLTRESDARIERWLQTLRDQGTPVPSGPDSVARLTSTIDGVCLGILNPGSPIDLEQANRLLRIEVDALLAAGSAGAG
ncbi:TetR/AcrR family transcriptional regulator [Nakamurella sp. DB0629]|uniref:TetR/AcrR family transcriptional regulator n=2 Tax=Nakamurella aerolata TaxID=1656892 RepID=A0A849AHQ5_9ACTN|nr:TetR/AcrR family transcriptional regulator [Nakamurella aerolata]